LPRRSFAKAGEAGGDDLIFCGKVAGDSILSIDVGQYGEHYLRRVSLRLVFNSFANGN